MADNKIIKGRVRKFGDNVNTDIITPATTLHLTIDEALKRSFEAIAKDYYKTVKPGDIIVAGSNFGCGSSREYAAEVVKLMGITTLVCESIARIYYRNCIALGLLPIISKGVSRIFDEGDEIEMDTQAGVVRNTRTGAACKFEPLSAEARAIIDAGGMLALLKTQLYGNQ